MNFVASYRACVRLCPYTFFYLNNYFFHTSNKIPVLIISNSVSEKPSRSEEGKLEKLTWLLSASESNYVMNNL